MLYEVITDVAVVGGHGGRGGGHLLGRRGHARGAGRGECERHALGQGLAIIIIGAHVDAVAHLALVLGRKRDPNPCSSYNFV